MQLLFRIDWKCLLKTVQKRFGYILQMTGQWLSAISIKNGNFITEVARSNGHTFRYRALQNKFWFYEAGVKEVTL